MSGAASTVGDADSAPTPASRAGGESDATPWVLLHAAAASQNASTAPTTTAPPHLSTLAAKPVEAPHHVDDATSSLATDTAGFDGPGGYYARAIAAGPHCAYFSSKRGLEWARDVDGVLQGGIVVPRAQLKAEVLGVAVGPVPSKGEADPDASDAEPVDGGTLQAKSVVFFTSYAPKSDGGGVYFVDEPAQCTNGNFSVSGKIVDITRRVPVEVVLNDTYRAESRARTSSTSSSAV